jgi:peroxiredoxin
MKKFIFLLALMSSVVLKAQNQTQPNGDKAYTFHINHLSDTTVYLANYYGEKLYYADTSRVDADGNFAFKAVPEDKQGKYAVVIPGPRYFELIIADGENIDLETDTTNLLGSVNVIESENNKIMYDYIDFLTERREEREQLARALKKNEGKPRKTKAIKQEYNALNDRVTEYQKTVAKENPDQFAAKEILMSVDVQPPAELLDDKRAAYYYYKEHYFDNIDLKDDRIVRTPVFHNKLVNYLNETVAQDPDTIIKAVDKLIAKLEPGSEVFKYVVHYTTYNFETSKIMGMDKVFVHMVNNYYNDDQAFWMSEDKLERIREKADGKKYTLIGMKAPDLILQDTSGNWISTHEDIDKKYTVLFFYDPDCGHCKKETPKLVDFYNEFESDKLAVYAVSAQNNDKWTKFIKKHDMNFYNVAIPQEAYDDAAFATRLITSGKTNLKSLQFKDTFDVYSTPKVFILDENKVIKAKDIGVEQIGKFIERYESRESQGASR